MSDRYIKLLKRASSDELKQVLAAAKQRGITKQATPSPATVGETLGRVGRTLAQGVGKYLSAGGNLGGSVAKGFGGGETAQAVGKAVGILGAGYAPIYAAGKTRIGRKVEHVVGRGVGAMGRRAQRFVDPYDPYSGQY